MPALFIATQDCDFDTETTCLLLNFWTLFCYKKIIFIDKIANFPTS